MKQCVSTILRTERGQMIMLAALLATAFLGFVGLVIDTGFAYAQRRQAQNGADNAALAAARVLLEGGSQASGQTAALEYADANGYDNLTDNSVTVNIPPLSGDRAGDPDYVEVIVEEQPTTFFIHALIPGGSTVRARGVAGTELFPAPYAVIALDPHACDAYRQTGSASLSITGGGVMVNSDCATDAFDKGGTGDLLAEGTIDVNGGYEVGGSGTVSPEPRSVTWTVSDPLASVPPPPLGSPASGSPGTAADPDTWKITSGGTYTLQPGTYYGGLEINCSNCTINLASGIYIMAGGGFTKAGNPTIVGHEVMIYVTDCNGPSDSSPCSGDGRPQPVKLTGGGVVDLSPHTSGVYQGITFWQDEQITDDFSINGDNSLVQGIFYVPGARLDLGGGTTLGLVQLVANTIRVSGNAPVDLTYGEFRTFEAPDVVLVE